MNSIFSTMPPAPGSANSINGNDANNVLHGTHADEIIHGLAGDDIIHSSPGNDELWGDAGNDNFVINLDHILPGGSHSVLGSQLQQDDQNGDQDGNPLLSHFAHIKDFTYNPNGDRDSITLLVPAIPGQSIPVGKDLPNGKGSTGSGTPSYMEIDLFFDFTTQTLWADVDGLGERKPIKLAQISGNFDRNTLPLSVVDLGSQTRNLSIQLYEINSPAMSDILLNGGSSAATQLRRSPKRNLAVRHSYTDDLVWRNYDTSHMIEATQVIDSQQIKNTVSTQNLGSSVLTQTATDPLSKSSIPDFANAPSLSAGLIESQALISDPIVGL